MPHLLFAVLLPVMRYLVIQSLAIGLFQTLPMVGAFDMSVNTNLAVYWGQNSYGATHPSDTANWQKTISFYCQDDTVDIIPMAFLDEFITTGSLPSVNFANICSTASDPVYPGTQLPDCSFLASGIQTCQDAGKIVTISLGGATGSTYLANDAEGQAFAQVIWDLFLGGTSTTRPFGDVVLDGVDMDIEGGSQTGFTAFLTTLRQLMNGGSKKYYMTAAPSCPYPDAYIGNTINAVPFDAVFVQFYNNYCGVSHYGDSNAWNFATWDNWAKTVSQNPNVKVFIGAPASSTAGSGYVDASTLSTIVDQTRSAYSSFGGVMLWDMSQAYANNRYDVSVKNALDGGSNGGTPTTTPTTTIAPTTTAGAGSCAGVSAWDSNAIYVGGNQVTYNGDLWTAKWWNQDDAPGGSDGVWVDDGACTKSFATATMGGPGHSVTAQATSEVF